MPDTINILPSHSIQITQWDHCVERSSNGLIYATSVFLNAMSDHWYGLILNDYEAVMPLICKTKAGIRYYYMPPFMQQAGIIGETGKEQIAIILEAIEKFARYGDISFNFSNTAVEEHLPVSRCTNLLIDLEKGYANISTNYKKDAVENIKRAADQSFTYREGEPASAVSLYEELYRERMVSLTSHDYRRFSALCLHLQPKGKCVVREIRDNKNDVLCSAVLLKDDKRIYNLANAVTPAGRSTEANYLLMDQIFREYAGQQLQFDFEGSDLPGVKKFYENFGAVNQPYFRYHHNRLLGLLRFFKR